MQQRVNLNQALRLELNQKLISVDNIEKIFDDRIPVYAATRSDQGWHILEILNDTWNDQSIIRVLKLCEKRQEFTPNDFSSVLKTYHKFPRPWNLEVFQALVEAGAEPFTAINEDGESVIEFLMRRKNHPLTVLQYLEVAENNSKYKPNLDAWKKLQKKLTATYLKTPFYDVLWSIIYPTSEHLLITELSEPNYSLDSHNIEHAKIKGNKELLIKHIATLSLDERIAFLSKVFDSSTAAHAFFAVKRGLCTPKITSGSFIDLNKMLETARKEKKKPKDINSSNHLKTDNVTFSLLHEEPPSYSEITAPNPIYLPSAPPPAPKSQQTFFNSAEKYAKGLFWGSSNAGSTEIVSGSNLPGNGFL